MTKQPPTSLRIPDQTKQRVHAYATERGIPRNAAYVELLDRGLAMLRSPNSLGPQKPAKMPAGVKWAPASDGPVLVKASPSKHAFTPHPKPGKGKR